MQAESSGIRVLVVEDDENSRHAMAACLTHAGYEVEHAANGREAISKSLRTVPDVVLMDLVMPGLNGVDATAILKADPKTAGARVVAVTGSWLGSKPEWLQETGFDGAVRKPCTMRALLAEVGRVLGHPDVGRAPGATSTPATPLAHEIPIVPDGGRAAG
jgi:two-component system cell cycle response regulator DivK